MPTVDSLAAVAADRLATASLQAAVVVACVWLLTRWCAAPASSLRAWLWWAVSLKLLLSLAGIPALPLPVLPAHPPAAADDSGAERALERTAHHTVPAAVHSAAPASTAVPGRPREQTGSPALVALIGLWVAGVAAGLARLAASHRRVRRLVRRSAPVRAETVALAAGIAATLRLRRIPDVRVSADVQSPQVARALRSVVLLPESVEQGDAEDLRMALCHELAHVKRRDLLFGWIPVLASRVFFFHPLAHAAAREYALAREAACDSIVLQALRPDPAQYGRLLVRLGVFRGGALVPGATSTSSSALRRRLEMLNDLRTARGQAPSRWLVMPGIALVLLPVQLVAGAAGVAGDRETARGIAYAGADAQAARTPQADDAPEAAAAGQRAREETADAERRAREETAAAIERAAEQARRATEEARARAATAQAAREAERQAAERQIEALSEKVRALQQTQLIRESLEQQLRQAREQAERTDAIRQETIRVEELRAMQEAIAAAQAARQQPEAAGDDSRRSVTEVEAARRALAELAGDQQSLAAQLETIARAQETLAREQQSLQRAQQRLVEAQQQLSEALERIREAIKENQF